MRTDFSSLDRISLPQRPGRWIAPRTDEARPRCRRAIEPERPCLEPRMSCDWGRSLYCLSGFRRSVVERLRHQTDAPAKHGRTLAVRMYANPIRGPKFTGLLSRGSRGSRSGPVEIRRSADSHPVDPDCRVLQDSLIGWLGHIVTVVVVAKAKVDHERRGDAPVIRTRIQSSGRGI